MSDINVNNINGTHSNNSASDFTYFNVLKRDYNEFIQKMEKSDFKNAYTRFITEHSYLKGLIEEAKEENRKEEAVKFEKRLEEVIAELKKRGITIND